MNMKRINFSIDYKHGIPIRIRARSYYIVTIDSRAV